MAYLDTFQLWGSHTVPQTDPLTLKIGSALIRLLQDDSEVKVGQVPTSDDRADESEIEWVRWASNGSQPAQVLVQPALPDRPLVVAPEQPFNLKPGAEATIYPRVPIWVRISLAEDGVAILDVPSTVLSDTWWGTNTDGELSYWLPTSARRRVPPNDRGDICVCPIRLLNRSRENLPVERLAIRTSALPIYRGDGQLWAAQTTVTYRALDEGSDIEVGKHPPAELSSHELLAPPRQPVNQGFRARTFAVIRSLTGFLRTP